MIQLEVRTIYLLSLKDLLDTLERQLNAVVFIGVGGKEAFNDPSNDEV